MNAQYIITYHVWTGLKVFLSLCWQWNSKALTKVHTWNWKSFGLFRNKLSKNQYIPREEKGLLTYCRTTRTYITNLTLYSRQSSINSNTDVATFVTVRSSSMLIKTAWVSSRVIQHWFFTLDSGVSFCFSQGPTQSWTVLTVNPGALTPGRLALQITALKSQNSDWKRILCPMGFPRGSDSKESDCNAGDSLTWVQFLGQEDPLERGIATHSSILA